MQARRLVTSVGILAAVFGVAACGGSDASTSNTQPAADLVLLAGPGLVWDKSDYTVPAGNAVSVAVVNRDVLLHTMVIVDAGNKAQGPELEVTKSGDTDTGTYSLAPGEYEILCRVPGHTNMKASLTVG